MNDKGQLMQQAIIRPNFSCMGTQGTDRLYHLDTPTSSTREYAFSAVRAPISKLEQLHLALGHLNYRSIVSMIRKGLIRGANLSSKELSITPPPCDACMKGKATRASFPASTSERTKSVLDLVHSDLWGPAPVRSLSGTCYVLTLTNDNSRWLWV